MKNLMVIIACAVIVGGLAVGGYYLSTSSTSNLDSAKSSDKNQEVIEGEQNQKNNKQSSNEISSISNQNKGNNLPQSYTQNNFTITIEKIELAKDKTEVFFKVINKNNFSVSFYPHQASIVQGTKQYSSKNTYLQSPTMPNVETDGRLVFGSLENRDAIILYSIAKPYSSSLPNIKWNEVKFKINLSGDRITDKVAREEAKKQAEKEAIKNREEAIKNMEYTKYLYPYEERDGGGHEVLYGDVNGHSLYYRILLFSPEEYIISIGYLDDEKKWNEEKQFVSANNNSGKFIKTNDPDYNGGKISMHILNDIDWPYLLRLESMGHVYRNRDDGEMYRVYINQKDKPIVLDE